MHKAKDYTGVDPECFQHLILPPRDSVWWLREKQALESLNTLGLLLGFERVRQLFQGLVDLWEHPDKVGEYQKIREDYVAERGYR
jgi:hypothetical protein